MGSVCKSGFSTCFSMCYMYSCKFYMFPELLHDCAQGVALVSLLFIRFAEFNADIQTANEKQ